jgi:beta-phosphoglucomutase-like phosphatase (HAD superfamily)
MPLAVWGRRPRVADAGVADRLAIFDVDGTLVDSTYHHALAWQRAFRAHALELPMWRIHREIGKGGDRLVPDLAGADVERAHGDALRAAQHDRFAELIDEVRPLDGAHDVLTACKRDGWRVALASSGRADELKRYLRLLDAEGVPDAVVSSADVATTKPARCWSSAIRRGRRRGSMTPVGVLSGGFVAKNPGPGGVGRSGWWALSLRRECCLD